MGTLNDAVDARRQGRRDDIDLSYWTVQPNRWTYQSRKIRDWVEQWMVGRVLNACAGKTTLNGGFHVGEIVRNDIDTAHDADHHIDVCEIASHLESESFDTVVFDPPYSQDKAANKYGGHMVEDLALAKRQFHHLLRPGGRVIQFGHTTTNMPVELEDETGRTWRYDRVAVAVFNTLGKQYDILGTVDVKDGEYQQFLDDSKPEEVGDV